MIALDTIKFNETLRSVLLKICFCFFTDGKYLALGSRDNHIYIYEVSEGAKKYSRLGRCSVRYFPKVKSLKNSEKYLKIIKNADCKEKNDILMFCVKNFYLY